MPGTDVDTQDAINGRGLIGAAVAVSAWGVSSVIAKRSTWKASPWRPTGSVRTDSSSQPSWPLVAIALAGTDAGLDGRGHARRLRCRTVFLGGEADHHRQRNRDRRAATDRRRHRGQPGLRGDHPPTRHSARTGRHRRRRDRRTQRRLRRTDRLARRPPRRRGTVRLVGLLRLRQAGERCH